VGRCPLREVLHRRIKVLKFIIPQFTDNIFEKRDAGM
jgi:hypothetical protein